MNQKKQRVVVLLADDDASTAAAWAAVLEMDGFEVVRALDGGAALALARSARPDLLLTDWTACSCAGSFATTLGWPTCQSF
jgi:DNA-binding response OmpR family regulator